MKRIMVFGLVLLFPFFVFAKEYSSDEIGLSLSVDDNYIVLTRDNLKNNTDLEKLNISEENIENIMKTNDIYFDIIKNDISYEILVVIPKVTPLYENLSTISDIELEELKTNLSIVVDSDESSVYKGNYNYIVVDYYDESTAYFIVNYYTVVNSKGYNIQLQKKDEIKEEDKKDLKEIVDSIIIKTKENNKETSSNEKKYNYTSIIYGAIIGLIAGIITYIIGINIIKNKSSK